MYEVRKEVASSNSIVVHFYTTLPDQKVIEVGKNPNEFEMIYKEGIIAKLIIFFFVR